MAIFMLKMKANENAETQMLTGFILLPKNPSGKVLDFNLFVGSRGTLVQSSPGIVVGSL